MDYVSITKKNIEEEKCLIEIYEQMLLGFPEGRLTSKVINGKRYYYTVDPHTRKHKEISIRDRETVLKMCEHRYAEVALKILNENIKAQERMLKKYSAYSDDVINGKLGKAYCESLKADRKGSDAEPASKVYKKDEIGVSPHSGFMHRTSFGLGVRSKSEALIAEMLKRHGIDFEYEAALELLDEYGAPDVRYPDFTLHIGDETIYWEHMGMLADDGYRAAAERKMHLYFINDIMPGSNLIVTCDDSSGKIDMVGVSRIVESLANDLRMKIRTCDGNDKLIE